MRRNIFLFLKRDSAVTGIVNAYRRSRQCAALSFVIDSRDWRLSFGTRTVQYDMEEPKENNIL